MSQKVDALIKEVAEKLRSTPNDEQPLQGCQTQLPTILTALGWQRQRRRFSDLMSRRTRYLKPECTLELVVQRHRWDEIRWNSFPDRKKDAHDLAYNRMYQSLLIFFVTRVYVRIIGRLEGNAINIWFEAGNNTNVAGEA